MWVKTYESFVYESSKPNNPEVTKLEKILKFPTNTGIISNVMYDKSTAELHIEQPNDMNPMDAGAVLASINKEKQKIKKAYNGVKRVVIGDLQITV